MADAGLLVYLQARTPEHWKDEPIVFRKIGEGRKYLAAKRAVSVNPGTVVYAEHPIADNPLDHLKPTLGAWLNVLTSLDFYESEWRKNG